MQNFAYSYDNVGNVKTITGGGTFVTQWGYSAQNWPVWMKYPGGNNSETGEQVTTEYNLQGLVNTLTGNQTYVQSVTYDALGRPDLLKLGADVLRVDYDYYPWDTTAQGGLGGQLQSLKASTPSTPNSLQNLTYWHDGVGNVWKIMDANVQGGTQTQTFTYDALNRLLSASVTGGDTGQGQYSEAYTYNAIGNLMSKGGVSYDYASPLNLSGCSVDTLTTKPHAVRGLTGKTFTYDCNGNMITRVIGSSTYDLTFDAENRLTAVSNAASASFVYDGDGNRVKATSSGVTTYFVGSYFEWSNDQMTKYYYAASQRVAVYASGVLNWLLGDHLGSTSITASANGSKAAELRYMAWGETRWSSGTTPTTMRYTGQREESGIGLYFYNARWYDGSLGRFISADTIVPNPGNPQNLNRYSYTLNNPVIYIDPSGHDEDCSPWDTACLARVAAEQMLDPLYREIVGGWADAVEAFLHLLEDPAYFAMLFADPQTWAQSDEAASLEVFAEYSILHTTADDLVLTAISDVYGAEAASGLDDLSKSGQFDTSDRNRILPLLLGAAGVPNPWGINGKPDHLNTVRSLAQMARSEFGESAEYVFNRSIYNATGLNRKPDVSVWRNGQLLKVFEAARVDI